ncbi:hypothetical protein [Streptomyces sp. NPDC057616]|uniref:hypothetical protein n=1 Tax=Streptomyces sp. NPDC057616 TaxID=3346183 RepID=UPI0036C8EF6B
MRTRTALVVGTPVVLAATAGVVPASASGGHSGGKPAVGVIAKGLDDPRQLSYDHGRLYVAEAGRGGGTCIGQGPEGPTCVGLTAAVTEVVQDGRDWHRHRLAGGLPSAGAPDGGFAVGLNGVSARHGSVWGARPGPRRRPACPRRRPGTSSASCCPSNGAGRGSPPTSPPWS